MAVSPNEIDGVFVIINNIPRTFHSSNLRDFFSSFLETAGFVCFHYRHRPEVQKPFLTEKDVDKNQCRRTTNCCIVKIISDRVDEFIRKYNGAHWVNNEGETLSSCCYIKKITFSEANDSCSLDAAQCKKGTVSTMLPLDQETFSKEGVESLIEMNPPSFMPNGNIGTKTSHFLNEIRACRLPPPLITKLGLQFPRNRAKRIFGCVPLDYEAKFGNRTTTSNFGRIEHETSKCDKIPWCSRKTIPDTEREEKEDGEIDSEEEEWDRVEALHDDVSGQERNKERLFEEKVELKWEKGGSGLVFYTDAQHWDAKEGDFDAKTADDWDIDTRIYEGATQDTDKDMKDLVQMRQEGKRRNDTETEVDILYDFAAFEKYTTGFGRKVLEAQGWKQGEGVGKKAGIAEPLMNEWKHPLDKKGLGYRGEKLQHYPDHKRRRRRRRHSVSNEDYFISTVYDDPEETDPPESSFASSYFKKLKYRQVFFKKHD